MEGKLNWVGCTSMDWGVKKDEGKAISWIRKSAKQGFLAAQINLGRIYEQGIGVKKDLDKALEWYRKAAKQGNELAKNEVVKIEKELNK